MKTITRRKYTAEEKIRIVLEGFRREVTVNELCRREGIKPHSYYAWTREFMKAGKERLSRNSVRDATQRELKVLKQLVGKLCLWRLCRADLRRTDVVRRARLRE